MYEEPIFIFKEMHNFVEKKKNFRKKKVEDLKIFRKALLIMIGHATTIAWYFA